MVINERKSNKYRDNRKQGSMRRDVNYRRLNK